MAFKVVNFGKALRMAMTERGYGCAELAQRCGRSPRKISELRNTSCSVTLITMLDIAKGLDMPVSELLIYGEPKQSEGS
jgi:transcriptional regulator with XRE-family HTH domain